MSENVRPKRYQVIAPMVVAKSNTPTGVKLQNFYKNAPLPPDVPQKQIDLFLRRRLIVELDEDNVPVPPKPAAPGDSGQAAAVAPAGKAGRSGAAAKPAGG